MIKISRACEKNAINTCEHCNSTKDIYELTIKGTESKFIKLYLCENCLGELNIKIKEKYKDEEQWKKWFSEGQKIVKLYNQGFDLIIREFYLYRWFEKVDFVYSLYHNKRLERPKFIDEIEYHNDRTEYLLGAFIEGLKEENNKDIIKE